MLSADTRELHVISRPDPMNLDDSCSNSQPNLTVDGRMMTFPFPERAEAQVRAPRLLDRDAVYGQSLGRLSIKRASKGSYLRNLRLQDKFHTLMHMSTYRVLAIVFAVFVISWLVFALLFRGISSSCGLQADTFLKALYLAIETLDTIGYGVPDDPFFQECRVGIFVLGASALWESILNAVLISLITARVARGQPRATSIIFSEKAIISQIAGDWFFMFQVCDIRKHQLCEAHVRLYSIQHSEAPGGIHFQTRSLRLQHPDDELGGMLLLALPQVVMHRIDRWSPLCPVDRQRPRDGTPANSYAFPDIMQRAADGENGNRDPNCGAVGVPRHGSPSAGRLDTFDFQDRKETYSFEEISENLFKGEFEVLCILEGIDAATSCTIQARHSYTRDDIVFNAAFHRSVERTATGECNINFDRFHDLLVQGESPNHQGFEGNFFVQSMS